MECVNCSKKFVINVSALAKGKENVDSTTKLNKVSSSATKTCDYKKEFVIVKEITNNESDSDDHSTEK